MRVVLDIRKGARENAAAYYEKAKKARMKKEKAVEEIRRTEKEIEEMGKGGGRVGGEKRGGKQEKKRWYEQFRWFLTASGKLVVCGRDAGQNELLVAKYFEAGDLFFHADVFGAGAVILKGGENAGEEELFEAAQFAASYSNAWKAGSASCDVYAARKEQVGKHAHGMYLGKGAFYITGERRWFRAMQLGIAIGIFEGEVQAVPALGAERLEKRVHICSGGEEKEGVAKKISAILGVKKEAVEALLPPGKLHLI